MKKCIHCGAELPDDAKACGNCGWPVGKPDRTSEASPEVPRVSPEIPRKESTSGSDEKENPSAEGEKTSDPEKPLKATNTSAADSGIAATINASAADSGKMETMNASASDSRMTETKSDGSDDQKAPAASEAHGVVWAKEDSEDKIDIPWDPKEADRKKAEAKNSGAERSSADAGDFGGDAGVLRGGDHEKQSDQPGGYWFQGKWHPISDLNSSENGNNKGTSSGDGRYWENGAWHDASFAGGFTKNQDHRAQNSRSTDGSWYGNDSNSGSSDNSWNGRNTDGGWRNEENRGWNAGNPNGGWPGNQGYGSYGQGYGPGYPARNNSFAVAAMVLAIVSIFLNSLYCIPSVLGIFFAIVALNQIRRNPGAYKGKGMAIAALIMCIVLFVVYLIAFIEVARLMRDPAFMKQIEDYLKQLQGGASPSAGQAAAVFCLR